MREPSYEELLRELDGAIFFIRSFQGCPALIAEREVYERFAAGGNMDHVRGIIDAASGRN